MSDELPQGWTERRIGDLLNALIDFRGRTPKKLGMDWGGGEIPALSAVNVRANCLDLSRTSHFGSEELYARWMTNGDVAQGDVVVTTEAPLGNVAVIPDSRKYILSQRVILLKPSRAVLPEFLAHQLRGPEFRARLLQQATGTTATGIRASKFVELKVRVPPLPEQRRIVSKVEALLARVNAARERLEKVPVLLKRFRQAVLGAACSGRLTEDWRAKHQPEPIARLIERTPGADAAGGRAATEDVIPGRCILAVGNPEREAPEGWAWVPLVRVARLESGHTPSRKHSSYWDGDVPWIGIQDAREHHGGTINKTRQTVTEEGLENSAARLLPAGTVCLSRTASVGYVVVMGKAMATSQDFVNWVCSDALDPEFLKYALMAEGDSIKNFGRGSTHTTIYYPEVKALHICLPPIEEQREIARRCESMLPVAERLLAKVAEGIRSAERAPQAILQKAFSGELVPAEAELARAEGRGYESASELLSRLTVIGTEDETEAKRTGRRKRAGGTQAARL